MRRYRCTAPIVVMAISGLGGCGSQTVIYKTVPEYQLREGLVPSRYVRDDGVIVINQPRRISGPMELDEEADYTGRIEDESGDVELRAMVPEQLIGNLTRSLLSEEYEFIWEQILCDETRNRFESEGGGFDGFVAWFERNRNDLYAMLNRMTMGIHGPEVIIKRGSGGAVRVQFHPHFAKEFQFSTIDMVWENNGLRLHTIHPTYRNAGETGG